MASFTKILVGNGKHEFMFNLDSIESLDMEERKVWTTGSNTPYRIHDDASWYSLLHWVETHKCPDYMC